MWNHQYFSRICNPVKIRKHSLKYFTFVLLRYDMKYFMFVLLHYNMKLVVVLQWNIDGWAWHLQRKIKKKLDRSQSGPSKFFGEQRSALKDRVFLWNMLGERYVILFIANLFVRQAHDTNVCLLLQTPPILETFHTIIIMKKMNLAS